MADKSDKPTASFPLAGLADDGWFKDDEATVTCFCGAVQIAFPTSGPGFVNTFVCHCTDCRKVTASMFASNFTVKNDAINFIRGRETLKSFGQAKTVGTHNTMTNYFCSICGTLMWRESSGFPNVKFMRIGTVDDFHLHETKLRPQVE
ncbi:uncharacterized protein NECHADRAFT_55732 [Fusarium vanettenii 77-13-4]|uniref:CENP-V/GFA domain-containing protein n=1 Tax=Fusarium vanettenii (strain ATCC MYA-4622 / CBS 123669 / FGSC 9596 / NRRL 45880 / 77-13-4) TaxID=660122 RepID=C7ZGV4_FUSV7|nr:uncharacterized protein NECHADRAFT_55732 [Fusarium vanettenii 77-13-4]EEU36781.1 hypothetical protein NECHADRAFT_55732 [Fusarium vanettenii 77-13-4]